MAGDVSFDVVSDFDEQELRNALDQVRREVQQRYDFKGVTVDLSDSGALIDGEVPAGTDTLVVLIPLLAHDGCFTGHGRIVRRCSTADGAADDRFAVAVPYFQLQRQSDALASLVTQHRTPHQQCHHP